jgi:hypothetical protein
MGFHVTFRRAVLVDHEIVALAGIQRLSIVPMMRIA